MKRDLVVLVADADIEFGLRELLSRNDALRIRPIRGLEFRRHPRRDPGTWSDPESFLKLASREFDHALVVLDKAWAGSPPREVIENDVEARLKGEFGARVRCVCIDPEVEQWVWSDSPHLANALEWEDVASLRAWLESKSLWDRGSTKPTDPKAALEAARRHRRIPKSPSLFAGLAKRMSVTRCTDPSFGRLLDVLRSWFPVSTDTSMGVADQ